MGEGGDKEPLLNRQLCFYAQLSHHLSSMWTSPQSFWQSPLTRDQDPKILTNPGGGILTRAAESHGLALRGRDSHNSCCFTLGSELCMSWKPLPDEANRITSSAKSRDKIQGL